MSRWRKATKVPLPNGACSQSRQSSTNCQRRSITVASITSSSETPVYASRMSARAKMAGATGGWPRVSFRYRLANSSCVLFDIDPNRMVRYPHECCLLERGNETLWMDDPPQPQPQHKHLRRISPGTRLAYAAEQWCQTG